jgi:hypothetical protein
VDLTPSGLRCSTGSAYISYRVSAREPQRPRTEKTSPCPIAPPPRPLHDGVCFGYRTLTVLTCSRAHKMLTCSRAGNHDVNSASTTVPELKTQLDHYHSTFGVDYHSFATKYASFVMVNSETLIAPHLGLKNDTADP